MSDTVNKHVPVIMPRKSTWNFAPGLTVVMQVYVAKLGSERDHDA